MAAAYIWTRANGGGAGVTNVAASAVSVPLRLNVGAWLIIRIHDQNAYLAAEAVPHAAVTASLSATGVAQFLLPVVYDNSRIRDYGAVVPINVPLTAFVSSSTVLLTDQSRAPPNPAGMAVKVTAPDLTQPSWFPPSLSSMFPRPTAKIIHFYTAGRK